MNSILICASARNVRDDGQRGGALRADKRTKVIIESGLFLHNYSIRGGAIYNLGNHMEVSNSTFDSNKAKVRNAFPSRK